jgi:hypothetical protein
VREGTAGLLGAVDLGQAEEHEPLAHRSHHCVVAVDRRRAAGDEADLPRPVQHPAAIGADASCPGAVVDLAEPGENERPSVPVHAEDGAEVFGEDDAEVADLAEEAALRGGILLPFRRSGQQRGFGQRRGGVYVRECSERGEQLRLPTPRRADEQ